MTESLRVDEPPCISAPHDNEERFFLASSATDASALASSATDAKAFGFHVLPGEEAILRLENER